MACWRRPCRRNLAFSSLLLAIDWALEWTSLCTTTGGCGGLLLGPAPSCSVCNCKSELAPRLERTGISEHLILTGAGPAAGRWLFGLKPEARAGDLENDASASFAAGTRRFTGGLLVMLGATTSLPSWRSRAESWSECWDRSMTFPVLSTCLVLATTNNPISDCLCVWKAVSKAGWFLANSPTSCFNPREPSIPRISWENAKTVWI